MPPIVPNFALLQRSERDAAIMLLVDRAQDACNAMHSFYIFHPCRRQLELAIKEFMDGETR